MSTKASAMAAPGGPSHPHMRGAYRLDGVPSLPVVGEKHPLILEFKKWLWWSNGVALALFTIGFASWYWWTHREAKAVDAPVVRIVRYTDLGVPPSISKASAPQVNLATQVAPPSIGVPEPVPDFMAQNTTIATQEEMSEALTPISMEDMGGSGGDSLVVDLETDHNPSPDEFVAVEEMPVLIQIPAPVYPEMARSAEVEATVMIRALVGKDGKVADAIVTEGHPMLNDAAIAAAKKATFKPALQQHRPVAVWVQIPMKFSLH
ncbi:MAG: TonB family protein [Candidatus Eisenbacteria bacterium]